jgi:hypothetical protein
MVYPEYQVSGAEIKYSLTSSKIGRILIFEVRNEHFNRSEKPNELFAVSITQLRRVGNR